MNTICNKNMKKLDLTNLFVGPNEHKKKKLLRYFPTRVVKHGPRTPKNNHQRTEQTEPSILTQMLYSHASMRGREKLARSSHRKFGGPVDCSAHVPTNDKLRKTTLRHLYLISWSLLHFELEGEIHTCGGYRRKLSDDAS